MLRCGAWASNKTKSFMTKYADHVALRRLHLCLSQRLSARRRWQLKGERNCLIDNRWSNIKCSAALGPRRTVSKPAGGAAVQAVAPEPTKPSPAMSQALSTPVSSRPTDHSKLASASDAPVKDKDPTTDQVRERARHFCEHGQNVIGSCCRRSQGGDPHQPVAWQPCSPPRRPLLLASPPPRGATSAHLLSQG